MTRHRVILHIGTHRTGTTSLQSFLLNHRSMIDEMGFCFCEAMFKTSGHVELHLASMRDERSSPARASNRNTPRALIGPVVANRVRACLAGHPGKTAIFSNEGLSYLRYPDEIDALKTLFGDADLRIVLYLRDKRSFLASYKSFLLKHRIQPVNDPSSYRYVERDSWLTDYDALIDAYATGFGQDRLTVLNYESEMELHGGTVCSFFTTLGIRLNLSEEPKARASGETR